MYLSACYPASIHTSSQDIDTLSFRGAPCWHYFICQPQAFSCTPAPLPAHVSHLLLLPCIPKCSQSGHIAFLSLVSQSRDHFQASQIFWEPSTAQQCPKSPWICFRSTIHTFYLWVTHCTQSYILIMHHLRAFHFLKKIRKTLRKGEPCQNAI